MKKIMIIIFLAAIFSLCANTSFADPMDDLIDQFQTDFEKARPGPYSSVNADYKFDQIAMSGLYNAKSLQLIYKQNQEIKAGQDEILKRYDKIIQQNREIIRLLTTIAKQAKR